MRKLSIWSSYYVDLDPYAMVDELKKSGIKYSELSDEHALMLLKEGDDVVATGKKFKKYADKHGVEFPQGHLWLGAQINHNSENTIETLKKWILLFEAVGVKNMVLHCDSQFDNKSASEKQKLDNNIAVLKELKEFLAGKDVVICLENLIDYVADSEKLMYIVNSLDCDNFGICLDTGHLNMANRYNHAKQSQREFILACGKKLKALHIADNDGNDDEHIMPFCNGNVDFKEVFKTLEEIGYDGLYNYEIPGERRCSLEIRKLKADYIKAAFESFSRDFCLK